MAYLDLKTRSAKLQREIHAAYSEKDVVNTVAFITAMAFNWERQSDRKVDLILVQDNGKIYYRLVELLEEGKVKLIRGSFVPLKNIPNLLGIVLFAKSQGLKADCTNGFQEVISLYEKILKKEALPVKPSAEIMTLFVVPTQEPALTEQEATPTPVEKEKPARKRATKKTASSEAKE